MASDKSHARALYFAFWAIGGGLLCPYNALVTASDYFAAFLGAKSPYLIAACLIVPNISVLLWQAKFGLPGTMTTRVAGGFIIFAGICVFVGYLKVMWAVLLSSVALGFVTAVVQGSMFELAGMCAPEHMAALSSGTAVGAIIICLIRLAIMAATQHDDHGHDAKPSKRSILIYFFVSMGLCVACAAIYVLIIRPSRTIRAFLHKGGYDAEDAREGEGDDSGALNDADPGTRLLAEPVKDIDVVEAGYGTVEDAKDAAAGAIGEETDGEEDVKLVDLVRACRWEATTVFMNFLVTLAIFPGMIASLPREGMGPGWFMVINLLVFNAADFVGKTLLSWERARLRPGASPAVCLVAFLRLLFLAAFVLMLSPHAGGRAPVIGAATAKWWAPLMCALLGFSNGYVGTYALVTAPGRVGEKSRGRVGAMMVFFLTFGLCIGSWVGVGAAFAMKLKN